MSNQDTTQISRYLLGQLPQEEMDRIETRLLSETGLFELAETVEDDVVDRYVLGELTPEERRRFERRLLPSQRIRERVELARALAAHGRRRAAPSREPEREATVLPFLRRPAAARLAWAASLVVFLLAGFLALQLVGLRGEVGELEEARLAAVERAEELEGRAETLEGKVAEARLRGEETAELQAELADAREEIADLRSRQLAAAPAPEEGRAERRVRDPGDYAKVFLALATRGDGLETLELGDKPGARLELDLGGQLPSAPVTATVRRNGVVVWQQTDLEIETFDGESMAVLVLPAEGLLDGLHGVELTEEDSGRLLGSYDLLVDR